MFNDERRLNSIKSAQHGYGLSSSSSDCSQRKPPLIPALRTSEAVWSGPSDQSCERQELAGTAS